MNTSSMKSAIVALVALVGLSTYSESALSHGSGGGGVGGLPTTGTCGFLLTMYYPFTYLYGNDPGNGWGVDGLGTINFATSTLSVNITLMDPAPLPSTQYPLTLTTTFTTSPGPIPNSFTITFAIAGGSDLKFNLIPVNGGKTILMQGVSAPGGQDGSITGTCQM